ncbi:M48 family metallopeptidase [bacterium]|nr:M48 family metallopeptidase [bacterium]
MIRIPGRFSDGQQAKSHAVVLTIDGKRLKAHGEDGSLVASWPLETVTPSSDFAVQALLLSTTAPDAEIRLATTEYRAHLYPHLHLKPWSERVTGLPKRRILFLAAVGMISVIALVWGAHALTLRFARHIPLSVEKKLFGNLVSRAMDSLKCPSGYASAGLEQLKNRLILGPEDAQLVALNIAPGQIQVIDLSLPNAFATLGGTIYVTSGLLKQAESTDEIAGILAHEMEHVLQRHVVTQVLDAYLGALLLKPFQIGSTDPTTLMTLFQRSYSRDDERSADQGAVRRLDHAGLSRQGMADFFKRMSDKTDIPKHLNFLSTHPASEERIADLLRNAPKPSPKPNAHDKSLLAGLKKGCSDK